MNPPSPKSLMSYQEILENTRLGRLCGKKELFQERYQIRQVLGRGGFGVTFLGRNVVLPGSPLCVIKQLCLPQGSKIDALDRARTRFRKEAKILSLLGHHSQIPLLLDYFVIDEDFYLVQEFIKGYTLSKVVKRYGVQPEEFVKRTLTSLLPVLSYIHARGVIHRDIKPQNVILAADDGRLVLIDFGSVKEELHLADETVMQFLTQHFIGTLGFSPPEQFTLRPVYASDIYSLGMTCLYLLTGKKPLDLQDEYNKNKIHWHEHTNVSPSFAKIIDRMIHHDLDQRYASALEVLHDLEKIEQTLLEKEKKNPLSELSEENFQQWMSVQSPSSQTHHFPQTPQSSSRQFTHPNKQKAIDASEYSADLFASYFVYNRLAQAKEKLSITSKQTPQPRDDHELNQDNILNKTSYFQTPSHDPESLTGKKKDEITEVELPQKSLINQIIQQIKTFFKKFIL